MNTRTGAILMAVMLVASALGPAAVTGQTTEESLSLDVSQDNTGEVTISVTDNGTAVENATVNVTSNETYAGTGEYETDANGTVSLAAPDDSVTVTVEATYDNASTTTTVDLEPALSVSVSEMDDGSAVVSVTRGDAAVENATVNVTSDDAYAGTGESETDENGTVSLTAPNESVTITVEAMDDNDTVTTTADLTPTLNVAVLGADDGSVVVSVTRGDTAVENATVNVTSNATYVDTGEFETDENGTVTLSNPEQTVELTITATDANDTATTSVVVQSVDTLAVGVEQAADGTATVSVGRLGEPVGNATVNVSTDSNTTYAGTGEYTTGDSGTVTLPAPSENVTVTVTATDDNETATTTADLTPPEETGPFGQVVSALAKSLKGAGFTGIGEQMSDFVTNNNPSNSTAPAGNASNPGVGNSENATPPGQQRNESGQPRVVPANPPVNDTEQNESSAPGNSGSAPGQADDGEDESESPGNSGSAPAQSDDGEDEDESPGNSGSAPG